MGPNNGRPFQLKTLLTTSPSPVPDAKLRNSTTMFRARPTWVPFPNRFKVLKTRPFCSKPPPTTNKNNDNESNLSNHYGEYKQLENLDFKNAAKILFTDPPKKKKFGFDFHLVQFFFACMSSFAVYLVAQYARYEMRKMEVDLELKKKKEEEEKAKEMELNATEEKEAVSDPQILEVKVRLHKLEETVKEIVDESKRQPTVSVTKKLEEGQNNEYLTTIDPSNFQNRSESRKFIEKSDPSNQKGTELNSGSVERSASGSETTPNAPWQNGRDKA